MASCQLDFSLIFPLNIVVHIHNVIVIGASLMVSASSVLRILGDFISRIGMSTQTQVILPRKTLRKLIDVFGFCGEINPIILTCIM